jgi:SAM-dependent methyltransferase
MVNYNERYRSGYMTDFEGLYEACRAAAVREVLHNKQYFPSPPSLILDIACGQGRYFPILQAAFPNAPIIGLDIAEAGVQKAKQTFPDYHYSVCTCEQMTLANSSVDFIFSIETLEHVDDADKTVQEWARVLKPGGKLLFTTPCANRFSLEWFLMAFSGGLQPSADGYGRFRRDEPGHLRRLRTHHVRAMFAANHLTLQAALFRSHFFTTLAHDGLYQRRPKSPRVRSIAYQLAMLDWRLFRHLPNGASMLVLAVKNA